MSSQSSKQPVVVLAEDDDALRELLSGRLAREGLRVVEIEDGYELRDYLELCRPGGDLAAPDLVISDVNMPGETGPEAIEHAHASRTRVVLISGCGPKELRAWAQRVDVAAVFEKPFDLDVLMQAVWGLLET